MFQIGNGGWYPIQKSRKRDPEQIAFPFPCGILLSINHKIRKVLKKWQKYMGLHGNLWVNQSEIHQNPPSVKRQSGITTPLRVAFIPFAV